MGPPAPRALSDFADLARGAALVLSVWALPYAPAAADEYARPGESGPKVCCAAVTALVENDIFAGWDGDYTDRHYTAGQYIFYTRRPGAVSGFGSWLAGGAGDRDARVHETIGLGSALFTPRDLSRSPPNPADRPYAGWLGALYRLSVASERRIDTVFIDVGFVGPAALGEPIQRNYHEIIRDVDPKGWDFQLENEPTLLVSAQRKFVQPPFRLGALQGDLRPTVQVTLGNAFIDAGGGLEFRIGRGLKSQDYGLSRSGPAAPYAGYPGGAVSGLRGWAFAAVDARYVARDLFIEGNSFGGDRTALTLKPGVLDFRAGVHVERGAWTLDASHVVRTEQFRGQQANQEFGVIVIARAY